MRQSTKEKHCQMSVIRRKCYRDGTVKGRVMDNSQRKGQGESAWWKRRQKGSNQAKKSEESDSIISCISVCSSNWARMVDLVILHSCTWSFPIVLLRSPDWFVQYQSIFDHQQHVQFRNFSQNFSQLFDDCLVLNRSFLMLHTLLLVLLVDYVQLQCSDRYPNIWWQHRVHSIHDRHGLMQHRLDL